MTRFTNFVASRPVTRYLKSGEMSMSAAELRMALYSRSEEHTSELQSRLHLVCRLLLEKKKKQHEAALHDSSPPLSSEQSTLHRSITSHHYSALPEPNIDPNCTST